MIDGHGEIGLKGHEECRVVLYYLFIIYIRKINNFFLENYQGNSEEEFSLVRLEGVKKVPYFEGELVVVEGFGGYYVVFVDNYQRVEKQIIIII